MPTLRRLINYSFDFSGGTPVAEYSYDPWGRARNPQTLIIYYADSEPELLLGRGYTGHEYLPWFGLYNMNARLYDPLVGRFLSPDPYVQAPDFTQNFNRYSYCLNNPLKYSDKDGEWVHLVIGAVIGGMGNLISNWNNCDGFWQYAASFGVGALAGLAVAATGGAVAAAGGTFWGTVGLISVGATSGAANAATGEIIRQTGMNFKGLDDVDWGLVGDSAIVGGVAGAVSSGVGAAMSGVNIPIKINGTELRSPLLSSMIVGGISGGAGHIAAGTTMGLIAGENLKDAFNNSLNGIWKSVLTGAALSAASASAYCVAEGINPLNGRPLITKENLATAEDLNIDFEVERIKSGRKYTFRHDGKTFHNNLDVLPTNTNYTEYIVTRPNMSGAGIERIYVGANNTWYYSQDHHETFILFKP